ncbi:MAG: hypothetical protein ACOYNI_03540 [Acidimicrobiia bacterium]
MTRSHRLVLFVLGAVLSLFVLGACSSSSKSASTTTTAASSSSTTAAKESSTTSASKTTAPAGAVAGVECPPSGATKIGTRALGNGGTETDYSISSEYQTVLSACQTAFQKAGWAVRGGGGGGWGNSGGGGFGATKAAAHVQVEVGSNGGPTYVNVCSWPGPQSNDSCGDQDNDGQNDNND